MDRYRLLTFSLGLLLLATSAIAKPHLPNVIFIMADDLGWNDVSWNNPDVHTPNLQKMVNNGVTLNQAYAQSACTPSRAAYLTGYYPFRIGVQNSVVREGMEDYVPLDVDFLPKRLKEAGYSTHLIGKWHLGSCRRDVCPNARGFDTFLGLHTGYNDYYTKKIQPIGSHEDFDPTAPGTLYDFFANTSIYESPETDYTTDIFTDRAKELIREFRDSPFFIALHYTAPHWPLQAPPENKFMDMYDDYDSDRQTYLAMISAMDEGIGEVIQTLNEEKLMHNTVIMFLSDNGGDTHFAASNDPLKERKTTLFEGGTRVPGFVYSPHIIDNTPRVSYDLFHVVDFFSTILQLADVNPGNVDSLNQWDMLKYGVDGSRKTFIYNIFENNAAIRAGRYKLIEGDPYLFQARRKKRSVPEAAEKSKQKRRAGCIRRRPDESDTVKMMKAFNSLTGVPQIEEYRKLGGWTMDLILEMLEMFGPQDVKFECPGCLLYDLVDDQEEQEELSQSRPGIALYLHELLALYKAEEVEPVLKYPYQQDPRSLESIAYNLTSNTWCEEPL